MFATKEVRSKAPGLPDLLNWAFPVADGVILNKDGSLLAGWFYEGPDLDASPDTQLNWVSEQVNAALSRFYGGWSNWVDVNRLPAPTYFDELHSHFPDPVSLAIDEERREHFTRSGQHFESEYALMVSYMPPLRHQGRLLKLLYESDDEDNSVAGTILKGFEHTLMDIEDTLSGALRMRRMCDFEDLDAAGYPQRRSHAINYLHFLVTGEETSLNLQRDGFYLDTVLGRRDFFPGHTPLVGDKYIAVLRIHGFPAESTPGILSMLDVLPIPFRYSTRYIATDTPEARKQIGKLEKRWGQKARGFWSEVFPALKHRPDKDASAMEEQANDALARTNSGQVGTGYYTPTVILRGDTPSEATEYGRVIKRELSRLGFDSEIETFNATEAWLGSLPGHAIQNVRRPPVHTDNLADLLPTTGVWTGSRVNPNPRFPRNSPALLQAATTGSSPFWLNLGIADILHFLSFGPTGSGKSTKLNFIKAQFLRYPGATVWDFDKKRAGYITTKALRGQHYEVVPGGKLGFCPLGDLDTPADLARAEDYIETCFELQHGRPLFPTERTEVFQALSRLSTTHMRSLTHFWAEVQSQTVKDAIQYYTVTGPLGTLLDSEQDGLSDARLCTFEISDLMDMGERLMLPVFLHIFNKFKKSLRGQPALLLIDEAWTLFGRAFLREKVKEWLKELRKLNCGLGLFTQSLSDAARSGLLDIIMESAPLKIFGANDNAANEGTEDIPGPAAYYRSFGLNDVQIEIIRKATPKRHYYVVSPAGSRLIDLQLGPKALAVCGTPGTDENVARVNYLSERYGDQWTDVWFKELGIAA